MLSILYVVFLMYVWFDTNFFVDYSKLLGVSKFVKIDDWENWREKFPRVSYLDYLSTRHRNFITKLISCKQCLCFWFTIIICFLFDSFIDIVLVYMASLIVYNIYVWLLWKLKKS